tara:strand:- start:17818 stop:18729 length:912 start_codon:yes stop_codon:yes gene_type:complete
MLYSSFPEIVDPDSSPYSDTLAYHDNFEKTYSADAYTNLPDYSLSGLFDTDPVVGQSSTSTDTMSSNFSANRPFNPTLPPTGISASEDQQDFQSTFYPAPFGQLSQYQSGYALDPTSFNSVEPDMFSPLSQPSRTPSLCGDAQGQDLPTSPRASPPRPVKRESTISVASLEDETTSNPPQRKRGRPRREQVDTGPQSSGSSPTKMARLPHNQVERKYREGLNAELERLRKAVPTLPQSEDGGGMGQPKPSKAMVLSGAIDYIKRIEKERDALLDEVDRLKQLRRQSIGWTGGNNSMDDFLMDS